MIQSVFIIPQHAASIRTTSQQAVSVDSPSKLRFRIPITFQTCKCLFFAVNSSRIYSPLVRLCDSDTWLCPEGSVVLRCALLYHRMTISPSNSGEFLCHETISRTYTEANPPYLLDLDMAMAHTAEARRSLVMTLTTP